MTRINLPKLFLGPMSENIISAVCSYGVPLGFVASRRQVEYSGGYVGGLDTLKFCNSIRSINKNIVLERDHAGPAQGLNNDDGKISLYFDAKYFDIIHIDVWKAYRGIEIAAIKTAEYINYCENVHENFYEIGTEQDIRAYTPEELYTFLKLLKEHTDYFHKISYVVIQSGTSLEGSHNRGIFDEAKLKDMLDLCRFFNKKSKEHNGDYLDPNLIKQKYSLGLDAINIAPELGRIETQVVIEKLKENPDKLEKLFDICFHSGKWQRWLGSNFNGDKENLIEVCGHYVFNNHFFKILIQGYEEFIQLETEKRIHNFIKKIL